MRPQDDRTNGVRASALWGSGTRTGETRQSALWGKGGKRLALVLAALTTLVFPLVADAGGKSPTQAPDYVARWLQTQDLLTAMAKPTPAPAPDATPTYISPDLAKKAASTPAASVSIIVQSEDGTGAAVSALAHVLGKKAGVEQLDLVGGAAVDVAAAKLNDLLAIPGLTITPDAPVRLSGSDAAFDSKQMWAAETGNSFGWGTKKAPAPHAPSIAVVDSGIDANRADFGGGSRVVAQVDLTSLPGNSAGDGRGHGTFVAGIAAGSAPGYAGASPNSNIVSIDVMDDQGMARTSDVIRAAQWILANKATYDIRVANFSLHSTTPSNFTRDPLDKAVEALWFGGVTVVAAAGNYGTGSTPSGVLYAPGNDPFVITVGALDLGKNSGPDDDTAASWSAYGYTYDGFMKPEVSAPGRFMVGPVPMGSTLASEHPENVTAPGYMQLSGTSFAAPVVAGTVAQMLALHPTWTPGQVKGVLMATTRKVSKKATPFSVGTGVITAYSAMKWSKKTLPNPNSVLDGFVTSDGFFDGNRWLTTATANPSWDAAAWQDVSWHSVSWQDVSWQDVSWNSVSWHDVSWNDMVTSDAVGDRAREDAAEGDANHSGGVYATDDQVAQAECDPTLNPTPPATCSQAPAETP